MHDNHLLWWLSNGEGIAEGEGGAKPHRLFFVSEKCSGGFDRRAMAKATFATGGKHHGRSFLKKSPLIILKTKRIADYQRMDIKKPQTMSVRGSLHEIYMQC